jgi:hypothetical protein
VVAALEPAARSYGRSVLFVRRLSARAGDERRTRERLATLRRTGLRPARGSVDVSAEAVVFEDEAELLLCLSEDLLLGRAWDRWWWGTRLAGHRHDAAGALASAWLREPRWVPKVLTELRQRHPDEVRTMLSRMGTARVTTVLNAVAVEHLTEVADTDGRGEHPEPPLIPPLDEAWRGPPRVLLVLAAAVTRRPGLLRQPRFAAWLKDARAAGEQYAAGREAVPSPGRTTPLASTGRPRRTTARAITEDTENANEADRTAQVTPLHRPRPGERPPDGAPRGYHRPWEGGGAETGTQMATMLYVVNVIDRFGLDTLAETSTGWAVVEATARWLLRDLPDNRRRSLRADPLLTLFGELDTRPAGVSNPVQLGMRIRPVRSFMTRHGLDVTKFTQPGRVLVSRTHVDVVLALDQIDLTVRACGLDQDPGWVPHLGRIVLFHFEDPQR